MTDALKKKGLRLLDGLGFCLQLPGDRCPEEEGIKTGKPLSLLERLSGDRCPEEEGIKTLLVILTRRQDLVTDALKKKGLRPTPGFFCPAFPGDRCPEEEGIKTRASSFGGSNDDW